MTVDRSLGAATPEPLTPAAQLTPPYVFGASAIGPLHVKLGLPCQDACGSEVLGGGLGVVAVADGLGSAAKSELGARTAVEAALAAFRSLTNSESDDVARLNQIATAVVGMARRALEEEAADQGCELRDLACTIIVLAFRHDTVSVAHVGDGAVVVQTATELKLISGPDDSEYSNEVVPLTGDEWPRSVRVSALVEGVESFAAFTDGCQRAALAKRENQLVPHQGFFGPIFAYARALTALREGEREIAALLSSTKLSANSEDDKTLVVGVVRRKERTLGQ